MNATENAHLTQPNLSHEARSLYLLYLRPRIERGIAFFGTAEVASYLENRSESFPVRADPALALAVLNELERAGFIARTEPSLPFDGQRLRFPLFDSTLDQVPERPFPMSAQWRPGPSFAQACLMCGLPSRDFSDHELRAFTSYWASKPEKRVQIAWERAFAQRLLKNREAKVPRQKFSAADPHTRTDSGGIPLAEAPRRALFTAEGASAEAQVPSAEDPARDLEKNRQDPMF